MHRVLRPLCTTESDRVAASAHTGQEIDAWPSCRLEKAKLSLLGSITRVLWDSSGTSARLQDRPTLQPPEHRCWPAAGITTLGNTTVVWDKPAMLGSPSCPSLRPIVWADPCQSSEPDTCLLVQHGLGSSSTDLLI